MTFLCLTFFTMYSLHLSLHTTVASNNNNNQNNKNIASFISTKHN